MTVAPDPEHSDTEQPFIAHLVELRGRLLRVVVVIAVLLLALLPFANVIYAYVAAPLMARMPKGTSMIAIGVTTPFMAPFKLTLLVALVLAVPYILYEIWGFVAPGLYLRERRLVLPLLVSSTLLFYVGMAFAYFIVFPMMFGFFVATAPPGVAVMTDISQYLDFVSTLFLAFGAAFEVPIATILLVWMGVLTTETLVGQRRYIILGAFVVSMFLTPPDAFSQTLLAVPMWLLFEAGVFFSRYFVPNQQAATNQAHNDDVTPPPAPEPIVQAQSLLANPSRQSPFAPALPAPQDPGIFHPLTDAEMEAELDAADVQEAQTRQQIGTKLSLAEDAVERKLVQIHNLRQVENYAAARALLYQVLSEGNAQQRLVARNILEQLDLS